MVGNPVQRDESDLLGLVIYSVTETVTSVVSTSDFCNDGFSFVFIFLRLRKFHLNFIN